MSSSLPSWLQEYLSHRRRYEVLLAIGIVAVNAVANVGVALIELRRHGHHPGIWEPITWEVSSGIVVLLLLPLLLWFDRLRPLQWGNLRSMVPRHLAASIVFCVVHVSAMVGIRKLVYVAVGSRYDFGNVPVELLYEYLKDVRTYFWTLALIYAYRYILLRLQGEVRLLDAPDVGPAVEPVERPQRFLVRKLGKEFLIAAADVEWLEAQGNYVNLHVRERAYPLRSTMTAVETLLDPTKFVRVHRSHIVNLDHVAVIEPLDTGDARLQMRNGSVVPCSRTFRAALREKTSPQPARAR